MDRGGDEYAGPEPQAQRLVAVVARRTVRRCFSGRSTDIVAAASGPRSCTQSGRSDGHRALSGFAGAGGNTFRDRRSLRTPSEVKCRRPPSRLRTRGPRWRSPRASACAACRYRKALCRRTGGRRRCASSRARILCAHTFAKWRDGYGRQWPPGRSAWYDPAPPPGRKDPHPHCWPRGS